jgi:hypothetical protein
MKATTLLGKAVSINNTLENGITLWRMVCESLVSPLCSSIGEQNQRINNTRRDLYAANGERVRQDCEWIA